MTDKLISATSSFTPNRRQVLGFGVALCGMAAMSAVPGLGTMAHAQGADVAQQIADHFSSVKSMTGEFVQFGPRGDQTEGKFFLERPGKIRFNYNGAQSIRVVSDGQSVVILNQKMRTSDLYPLSKTPLKLLLDNHIDLSGNKVVGVDQQNDLITIKLADRQMFGNSTITMMFDPKTYELRQWTITDAQGKDTTVMIFNTQQGVSFPADTFAINYTQNREWNNKKKND